MTTITICVQCDVFQDDMKEDEARALIPSLFRFVPEDVQQALDIIVQARERAENA